MAKKIFLETRRLELVVPSPADIDFCYRVYEDPKLMAHLNGPLSREWIDIRVIKWMDHWREFGFGVCLVRLKATQEFVGVLAVFHKEIEGEKVLEMGWVVLEAFHNQGIASEAAAAYLEYARENLYPRAIAAFPGMSNLPSNRITQKLGFKPLRPFDYKFVDGVLHSIYWRLELD